MEGGDWKNRLQLKLKKKSNEGIKKRGRGEEKIRKLRSEGGVGG